MFQNSEGISTKDYVQFDPELTGYIFKVVEDLSTDLWNKAQGNESNRRI